MVPVMVETVIIQLSVFGHCFALGEFQSNGVPGCQWLFAMWKIEGNRQHQMNVGKETWLLRIISLLLTINYFLSTGGRAWICGWRWSWR